MVDLDHILSFDQARIKSKEAEIVARLLEFTMPARKQLGGARRERGNLILLEDLSLFVSPHNLDTASETVKHCTIELFDVYAAAALPKFAHAEPFIALLPAIAERVHLKLGVIDKHEVEIRRSRWESVAWDRQGPGLRRWLARRLSIFRDQPKVAEMQTQVRPPVEPAQVMESGAVGDYAKSSDTAAKGPMPAGTAELPSPELEKTEESRQPGNRSDIVDTFLRECNREPGLKEKIIRKHIHLAALHAHPRQFQYWQARDPRATDEDEKNFGRLLAMEPRQFVALLRQRGIISAKS